MFHVRLDLPQVGLLRHAEGVGEHFTPTATPRVDATVDEDPPGVGEGIANSSLGPRQVCPDKRILSQILGPVDVTGEQLSEATE